MSLYGALFGGVSGLRAQSSKIGVISDNIANTNTVGYKQGTATFQTLVVNAGNGGSYQTGGVRGGTVQNISKQGLLQSTESATDIAISGAGFFVVRATPNASSGDSSSTPYYTRAGSFTQDSLGNFKNTQGFYLQGWPLDREGRLPGEVGNLNTTSFTNFDSLETVNVESASGVAQSTSTISLGANLKSSQVVYPGQSATLKPDTNLANNKNLQADAIIAGSEYNLDNGTVVNDVRRGDRFNVSTGNGLIYTYEYGGYSVGRQVSTPNGAVNFGDNNEDNTALIDRDASTDMDFDGTNSFILTIPNHGLIDGDHITLSGFGAPVGTTPASDLNATHIVQRVDANHVRITVATAHGGNPGDPIAADPFTADTRIYSGNVLDATSATGVFLIQTGVTGFTGDALTFSISSASAGTKTFHYTTTAPNVQNGEFNSLSTLAASINSVSGLTARVVDGRLTVGAEDASEAVTFTNGDATGTNTQRGIDWVGELGIQNVAVGNRRYSTLSGLASIVNADEGVSATVNNPLSSASVDILVDDPLDTIALNDIAGLPVEITTAGTPITIPAGTFNGTRAAPVNVSVTINSGAPAGAGVGNKVYISGLADGIGGLPGGGMNGGPYTITSVGAGVFTINVPVTETVTLAGGNYAAAAGNRVSIAGVDNQGSMLAQLGIAPSLGGVDYLTAGAQTSGVLGPQYDPTGQVGKNMASGDITAQFSRNVRVYDSLGSGHDVRFSFIKIAQNTWAVEAHMIPASDISTALVDGQIATGTIVFNGDGTLRSVSSSLQNPITVTWRNGAVPSAVSLNMGTSGEPFGTVGAASIGLSDGLSQFDSSYNVNFANQNGAPVGQLVSVAVTQEGFVVASYSNGQTQELYKLPLADFANPDGLQSLSGNIFGQTRDSGEVNLREPGTNGTGTLVSGALEASNVDLAEQLTDMIVAQRAYQANTRVIKTTDELLDQLNQI